MTTSMIVEADAIEFLKKLPSESVDLIFTDPPYNISKHGVFYRDYRNGHNGNIERDQGEWDYDYDPVPFLKEALRVLTTTGSMIIWTSEQLYGVYHEWMQKNMFPRQMLVWIKTNPTPQFRKMGYRQSTELMIWGTKTPLTKKNPNFIFGSQEDMKNIFVHPIVGGKERIKVFDKDGKKIPTQQKPIRICEKIIKIHCKKNGIVVDPYAGTGTIIHAAIRTGRVGIGCEINPVLVNIARERIKEVKV